MKWLLIFILLNGETAELPTTQENCYAALDSARRGGGIVVTLSDKRKVDVPALNVVCVEFAEASKFANAKK
jgi:hypothetical protein